MAERQIQLRYFTQYPLHMKLNFTPAVRIREGTP